MGVDANEGCFASYLDLAPDLPLPRDLPRAADLPDSSDPGFVDDNLSLAPFIVQRKSPGRGL